MRAPDFGFLTQEAPQSRAQEEETARLLVESLSEDTFDPAEYHDTYRAALEKLIECQFRPTVDPAVPVGP